ncbi:MAG: stage III sporulation protein AB [Oscillospiraceae bacterium]|nr:stage III sporulation protein AB [Oscillospiraceae bacterium]
MRTAAALTAVLMCALTGLRYSRMLSQRVRTLEKILVMIGVMRARLEYFREPVGGLIDALCQREELSPLTFLPVCREMCGQGMTFFDAWSGAVGRRALSPPLFSGDIDLLRSLGSALGATDIAGQLGHFEIHEKMFLEKLADARERESRYGKLYISLGVSAGVAAGLIIL